MTPDILIPATWALYLALFIAPFVQEDAAVIGSASAASMHEGDAANIFAISLLGLVLSDAWKYWAGYYAQSWPPAARWVNDPKVAALKEGVLKRLGLALLGARFIPGTRIPLYLACGVFRAPFRRFLPLIALTGALYLGLTFAIFAALGNILGEQFQRLMPLVVVAVIAIIIVVTLVSNHLRNQSNHANP
ncbi:MAG: VTT domain-containing protein [Terricaulis sp.]